VSARGVAPSTPDAHVNFRRFRFASPTGLTGRGVVSEALRRGLARGARTKRFDWSLVPFILVPVLLLLISGWVALYGEGGAWHAERLRDEVARTQRQLAEQREVNARLAGEVERLRNDERTVRRAIGEDLGLVEPGSTVFRFPSATVSGR
jgi:cell division protein FtsB